MSDNERISIGDKVTVTLYIGENVERNFVGVVKYVPVATGDSWVFLDSLNNIRYVQSFVQMIKFKDLPEIQNELEG